MTTAMTIQRVLSRISLGKNARNRVSAIMEMYTMVVARRVASAIFFSWVHGPYRKHVEHSERMLPIEYIVAKGI